MSGYAQCIQDVMNQLSKLPGIGARSAERITFHLLKASPETAMRLADAIRDMKTKVRHCSICYNLTEEETCAICRDANRDPSIVCVVEQPKDLLALESAGLYKGLYHVLLGRVAPLEDQGPEELTLPALMARLESGQIKELILGTNPNVDGDTTALHIQNMVSERFPQVQVTRLARGLPAGSNIEYANRSILADAILGRQKA
jgi:recombination protein RecR